MTPGMDLCTAPLLTPLTLLHVDDRHHGQRLATLGLREGVSFRLLTRTIGGGRILLVDGSRIALGRDLVQRLRARAA
ncbi:MAG TPA: FeoA domain-containing protein [Propionibacteriaceae bacterium]|nr:FeoA domain-containing protein [Propionibacteriaceae bacterium]